MNGKAWTKEQDQLVRDLYDGSKQIRAKLSQLTGRTEGAVRFRAGSFGLTTPRRRSVFDYKYFSEIDTEEKAYWLGFIFADGSVGRGKNWLTVSLVTEAQSHLRKLAKAVAYSGQVSGPHIMKWKYKEIHRQSEYFTLAFGEKGFIEDLARHGVIPSKTYDVKFPEIRSDLQRHFIRGVFDGDGCISQSKHKNKNGSVYVTPSMSLVGAVPQFLEHIVKIFSDESRVKQVKVCKRGKKGSTWTFSYQGTPALRVRDWMYENATVWMECKKDKFYSFDYSYKRPRDKEHQEKLIDEKMQKRGWQRLSEYNGWEGSMTIKCDRGHIWTTKTENFKNGKGCPKCRDRKNGELARRRAKAAHESEKI